ncbi:hypothetical protein FRC09_003049 [Ceratobasidium sp. 395]|nr:hypothetical protein FRC09_003049 [Ceratobasidium sp. 395]
MPPCAQKSLFDIPELVGLVRSYLDSSDSACLARSSRQLFQMLMPLLWEHVDGVFQLFALVPALNDAKESEKTCETPVEYDFSRFNVYSPWIKHLGIYRKFQGPPEEDVQIAVLRRYASTRVLLPNLLSIDAKGGVEISWVLPFLSPSLLKLEFVTPTNDFDFELALMDSSVLLHLLSKKCSNLQILTIRPTSNKRKATPDPCALEYVPEASEQILNRSCFETISTWPLLESLFITLAPYKSGYKLPRKLPDGAFPSLKRLDLYSLPDYETFAKFWNISALVSKLTTVRLLPSGEMCYEKKRFNRTLLPVFTSLVKQSPHLEDLWFRALDPNADACYSVPTSTLEVLKKLPLQRLYIGGVNLREAAPDEDGNLATMKTVGEGEDQDEDEDEDDDNGPEEPNVRGCTNVSGHLISLFPRLKEFSLPKQQMSFAELATLKSDMPQLEVLRFDFDLRSTRELKFDLGSIARYRHSPFRLLEANFLGVDESIHISGISDLKYDKVALLVRYLFSLWPNVRIEAQPCEDGMETEYESHQKAIDLINEQLAALSHCNYHPVVSYEDVQILNEKSWKDCRD